jgi:hypothetical protein
MGVISIFRKAWAQAVGGYREEFKYAQDYRLSLRILERHEVASLGDILYNYRVTFSGIFVSRLDDAYHALARECARRRRVGLPEDLIHSKRLSENKGNSASLVNRLRARRAMAGYHLIWGRAL